LVEPSPLCPDPSRERWKEKEELARTPLLRPSPSLQAADQRDLASADPQYPVATTKPIQHAPEAAVLGVAFARCQGPRTGHLLAALVPALLAYIKPLRFTVGIKPDTRTPNPNYPSPNPNYPDLTNPNTPSGSNLENPK
jgi:hypothetical protein